MLTKYNRNIFRAIHMYNEVCDYTPPVWWKNMKKCPKYKVNLAMTPTPIHRWNISEVRKDVTLYIKRDDLTGSVLSGNKVRKLEFLLADALNKGCGSVITCGSLQSNHCRATATAAAQLGLKSHLILRSDEDVSSVESSGNLFLSRLCDSSIYLVPKRALYETDLKPRQLALAEAILKKTGKPSYCICVGGSDSVGLHGYLNAWEELLQQNVPDMIDDVVVACGSGGTIAGLSIGNYLTGSKVMMHAIAVCDDAQYFLDHVDTTLDENGIEGVAAKDIVDVIEGYKGAGYSISTKEDHELYKQLATQTGIFCDPVYSGKAIKGLLNELEKNSDRFKGKRILFIHTGGIFGMYDGKMNALFDNENSTKIFDWKDINQQAKTFLFN